MTHSYAPKHISPRFTRHILAKLRRYTARHGVSGQIYLVVYPKPRIAGATVHLGEATVVYPDWMNTSGQRIAVGYKGQPTNPVFSLMPWGTKYWREEAEFTNSHGFRLVMLDWHMERSLVCHPNTRLKPLPEPYSWEVRLINPGKKHPRFEHIRVPA